MPDPLDSAEAVRDGAERVFARAARGELAHFYVDQERLDDVAARVAGVTRATYPNVRAIPYHSRWRHFGAGGVDRAAAFVAKTLEQGPDERLAAQVDLAMTSVLLDAGAGETWAYREAAGGTYARSEGLAVASYDLFVGGAFSSDPARDPLRADAAALAQLDPAALGHAMQAGPDNPLVGLDGRAALLRRLGEVAAASPVYFGHPRDASAPARLGHLGLHLREAARSGELPASAILASLLLALRPVWPARGPADQMDDAHRGDVWTHGALGPIAFHKLSQWLAYSLCEPLEWSGVRVVGLDALTGLAEYRNGGLFVDGGVIRPVDPNAAEQVHDVGSDFVIEWRALTVALLDRTAARVRAMLGLDERELPLARVLEGGTWRAGRAIAAERRPGGGPPFRVRSDGTVF